MELPTPKKHEYPVLLLLAVLFGFVCPALNALLSNTLVLAVLHWKAGIPYWVWYLLGSLSAIWNGAVLFAALRFPLRRCVPLLLMPLLYNLVIFAVEVPLLPGLPLPTINIVSVAVYEILFTVGWFLVAGFASALGRRVKHELSAVTLLLLAGVGISLVLYLLPQIQNAVSLSAADRAARMQFETPSRQLREWLAWSGRELRSYVVSLAAYLALMLGYDRRGDMRRFFARALALLRRAWDATAA